MVGVPGLSQGCATCRRRRIRCDLGQPGCEKCKKIGRVCEGYARYATFVNRTLDGLQKRSRFEEVIVTKDGPKNEKAMAETRAVGSPFKLSWRELMASSSHPSFSQAVHPGYAYDQAFISKFVDGFYATDTYSNVMSGEIWVLHAVEASKDANCIQLALRALAVSCASRETGDARLQAVSTRAYGSALSQMQQALGGRNKSADRDELLAAVRLFSMYEFYEATGNSAIGWLNHDGGSDSLVKSRDPQDFDTQLSRTLLMDIANTSFFRCLCQAKRSYFSDEKWSKLLQLCCSSRSEFQRFQLGFGVCALLESAIPLYASNFSSEKQACLIKIQKWFEQAVQLDKLLNNWYNNFEDKSPSPMFWTQDLKIYDVVQPGDPQVYNFCNLSVALETGRYLAIKMMLHLAIRSLAQHILDPLKTHDGFVQLQEVQITCLYLENLNDEYSPEKILYYADFATRTAPYCIQDCMGLVGVQHVLIPIRIALAVLWKYDKRHENIGLATRILEHMSTRKGLGVVRPLDLHMRRNPLLKVEGLWDS